MNQDRMIREEDYCGRDAVNSKNSSSKGQEQLDLFEAFTNLRCKEKKEEWVSGTDERFDWDKPMQFLKSSGNVVDIQPEDIILIEKGQVVFRNPEIGYRIQVDLISNLGQYKEIQNE